MFHVIFFKDLLDVEDETKSDEEEEEEEVSINNNNNQNNMEPFKLLKCNVAQIYFVPN